jgi:paraquat-inducible protein B
MAKGKTSENNSESDGYDVAGSYDPEIKPARRLSLIWIIPFVAIVLGLWLVKQHFDEMGEVVEVSFASAEGLEVGKTEVRCRAVKIGELESISLTEDLTVTLDLRIRPEHVHLIREDSKFWVVRARISAGAVSGLGTLVSGAYIELDPGAELDEESGNVLKKDFVGLEEPPPTPTSVPGRRLKLVASNPGTVDIGSGVFFKNSQVGKIETRKFDPRTEDVQFGVFIEEEYQELVGTNSKFWVSSGLELNVGAEGIDLKLPSLESLLRGRVSFGEMGEDKRGSELNDGVIFPLYADRKEAQASSFESEGEFLLLFEQSVRGLAEGAPVEFRGLRVGRVSQISYNLVAEARESQTPVLIELSRSLLEEHFPPDLLDDGGAGITHALEKGLRASLKSSNLLTGQMYVDMDYYPDEGPSQMQVVEDYAVLPTIESGLGQMEEKVTALLKKFNEVPIESLLAELEETTVQAKTTMQTLDQRLVGAGPLLTESQQTLKDVQTSLKSLNKLIAADSTQGIPSDLRETLASINSTLKPLSQEGAVYGDLRRTLDELRSATRSVETMTNTISEKPNSLIFGKKASTNKIPRAKR